YLELDGVEAIAPVSEAAILNTFASVICAPWPNRIEDGVWKSVNFPGNDSHGNALHGLVFDKHFEVKEQTDYSATLFFRLAASSNYPFELEIGATYLLTETGITVTYFAKNVGSGDAPYGVAAHPYFKVAKDSKFAIHAKQQAINNEKQIPIGLEPATKAGEGLVFGETTLDDCFIGLTGDVVISHADGSTVTIWQDDAFKYLMVYTGHHLDGLAIEPQTCPANAFNTGEDLIWLAPGQSWQANWGVTAKGAHV
ncbi:MAG: hypothetical protein ACKOWR_06650, partial [Micrococcales bacterium]